MKVARPPRADGGAVQPRWPRAGWSPRSRVWTYLGLHAMDSSDPAAPKIVHAFMPRATEGYSPNTERAARLSHSGRRSHS